MISIKKVFYEDKRLEVGTILKEPCRWKRVKIDKD